MRNSLVDSRVAGGVLMGFLLSSTVLLVSFPVLSRLASQSVQVPDASYDPALSAEGHWTADSVGQPDQKWFNLWGPGAGTSAAAPDKGHVICWASWNHGGYGSVSADGGSSPSADNSSAVSPPSPRSSAAVPGGVMIYGKGCKTCTVGSVCSFTIRVRAPAQWMASVPSRRWELMVHLRGPSLVIADVKLLPPMDGSSFLASYILWDPGLYRVSVRSSCNTLNYTAGFQALKAHEMATWNATVLVPGDERRAGQAQPLPSGEAASAVSLMSAEAGGTTVAVGGLGSLRGKAAAVVDQRPCMSTEGLQARWLRSPDTGNYSWEFFPCSKTYPVHEWIPQLNKVGIYEISFLGDSHQRTLMHHLLYLVSREVDWPHHQVHSNLSYTVNHTEGGSLRLNLYFVKGIYAPNSTFQCGNADRAPGEALLPEISPTSDAVVVEAGYWTGVMCAHPEKAFVAHLPAFMLWLETATSVEKTGKKTPPVLMYRSTPPRPTDKSGCYPLTNVYMRYVNEVAKGLCPLSHVVYFDSWQIEASRYLDNCPGDHHYSCVTKKFVWGPVGEADVKSLIHSLIRQRLAH